MGTGLFKLRRVLAATVSVFAIAMWALAMGGTALADTEIGSPGSGAGQTQDPRGVVVDEEDDLLYVADRGNNRISVFSTDDGEFVRAFGWGVLNGANELQVCTEGTGCQAGIEGSGKGQLKQVLGIAVDNAEGTGSVYVHDVGNRRIQKFTAAGEFVWMAGDGVNATTGEDLCTAASGDTCGPGTGGNANGQLNVPEGDTIDVGPGGTVYVGDRVLDTGVWKTRVQTWSPEGAYLGLLGGKLLEVSGGAGNLAGLGVDSAGNIYVGTNNEFGTGAVRKYDSTGTELIAFNPSFNVNTVAVGNEDDHVFVGDFSLHEGEFNSAINEYDPTGTLQRVIYGSLVDRTFGLAVDPSASMGNIFATEGFGAKKLLGVDFPPPGPVAYPKPSTVFADPIGSTKATLRSKVNPEGEVTTYHFEYISDEDFDDAGETFGAGTIKTPESAPLSADFTLHPVQAQVTGLFPETVYHFRVVAKNASGEDEGPVGEFETKDPIEFGDIWSTDVDTDSANLHIEANTQGLAATGRFEYVELGEWEATGFANATEAPPASENPIDLGEGEEMLDFSAQVSGLQPGTSYRYRFVATNRCKPEPQPLCQFAEPEGTFTTFSPLDPITGCPNDALRAPNSSTFLPDCRAYEMVSPVDKAGADVEPIAAIPSGFYGGMDRASADGNSITYSAGKAFCEAVSSPYNSQYLARRGPSGWGCEAISPPREGPALVSVATLDRQYKAFSEDLCEGWVFQGSKPTLAPGAVEGYPGLYRRDNCDPEAGSYEALTTVEPPNLPPRKFIPEFQGASEDGSVAIFGVNDNLTPGIPAQPADCVSEPEPNSEPCQARLYELREGQLKYVCILPGETPWAGDCGAGSPIVYKAGGSERSGSLLNAISDDGSHIFWSTSASTVNPGTLYVRIGGTETIKVSAGPAHFWTAGADGSKAIYSEGQQLFVFDVASETSTPIAGGLVGVAGASEDLSRVYFASSQVLPDSGENSAGDEAVAGRSNLYLYEPDGDSELTFVGALAAAETAVGKVSAVARSPLRRLSRVTSDGRHFAFMSSSPLTGYDNKDAVNKEADYEVFLYDAADDQLLCPSCNPTGARPEGRGWGLKKVVLEERFAAWIPNFTGQLYGARVLTEDGSRLYFNSSDRLAVNDVNEAEDVYQWQEAGAGSCTTASPTYHEVSGGCVDLISSGNSAGNSELVDISTDGRDVFFKTFRSLVPQDPSLLDIYDARVEGGFPPPPPPVQPPPPICKGAGCQVPVPPPLSSPPPSGNPGPRNPPPPKAGKPNCRKGKKAVKRKGKWVCVKKKQNRKQSKKRGKRNGKGGQSR